MRCPNRDWKQVNLSKDNSEARSFIKKLCYSVSKYNSNHNGGGRLAKNCLTVVRSVPLFMREVDDLIFYAIHQECFISRTATQSFVTVGPGRWLLSFALLSASRYENWLCIDCMVYWLTADIINKGCKSAHFFTALAKVRDCLHGMSALPCFPIQALVAAARRRKITGYLMWHNMRPWHGQVAMGIGGEKRLWSDLIISLSSHTALL